MSEFSNYMNTPGTGVAQMADKVRELNRQMGAGTGAAQNAGESIDTAEMLRRAREANAKMGLAPESKESKKEVDGKQKIQKLKAELNHAENIETASTKHIKRVLNAEMKKGMIDLIAKEIQKKLEEILKEESMEDSLNDVVRKLNANLGLYDADKRSKNAIIKEAMSCKDMEMLNAFKNKMGQGRVKKSFDIEKAKSIMHAGKLSNRKIALAMGVSETLIRNRFKEAGIENPYTKKKAPATTGDPNETA